MVYVMIALTASDIIHMVMSETLTLDLNCANRSQSFRGCLNYDIALACAPWVCIFPFVGTLNEGVDTPQKLRRSAAHFDPTREKPHPFAVLAGFDYRQRHSSINLDMWWHCNRCDRTCN
jgi:hypothetical protein